MTESTEDSEEEYQPHYEGPYSSGVKGQGAFAPEHELWYGVDGPEPRGMFGLGYHSHTLSPRLSMKTKNEAERAAEIANMAYAAGYERAQYDVRKALGVTNKRG